VLRWSRFKDTDPTSMYETVNNGVFPFLRTLVPQRRSARST